MDTNQFHANSHRENREAFAAACERYYEETFRPKPDIRWDNPLPPDFARNFMAEMRFQGGNFVSADVTP